MTAKIAGISVRTHCNHLGGKIWNPAIRWTDKYAVFIRLEDDTGQIGLGECWCFDAAPDALVAYLRTEVMPHFQGASLEDVADISQALFAKATLTARHGILASALSGIDIAAWDLNAKHQDAPIWKCLSDGGTGDALIYASGGLYGDGKSVDDLCSEMAGHAARGFRLSKMKIGAQSIEADADRVNAVLGVLPVDAKLIIDGVNSYSSDDALRIFDKLPQDRIEAFQSPTKAWDYAGMARLSKAGIPVMASEAEYRPELHAKLVEDTGVAFLQTAPIASGGLTGITTLASLVADTPTRLSLEVSSTAIALMAAIHAAAADPQIAHVEYHTVHTVFFEDLKLRNTTTNHQKVSPPADPGLGISLPDNDVSVAFETGNTAFPNDAA